MNLLNVFFLISWFIILVISLDVAKKQKFNALHFLVFIWVWLGLFVFSFFPWLVNVFWYIFWIQRGADVLVYISIIFLLYFVVLLLNKIEQQKEYLTQTIREIAIQFSQKTIFTGNIVLLIRAYNEWSVLWNTIEEILKKWYPNILVVDDGSTDNTQEVLSHYKDKIVVVKHLKNRWGGAALETWFEYLRRYADVEYVCCFDADWQHNIEDLSKFMDVFQKDENTEVVIGSRFIEKTNTNIPLFRKIILKWGIIFTLFISNIKLTDSHNGYRVFRLKTLQKLKLTIDDMSYASELIELISQKNIKFKEVPVNILYTDYSRSKWQKSSNAINIALKTIWYKFFK